MKLLILGGTWFLGRHLVEAASQYGHEVTIFNRGRHDLELFPEVEKLKGDREGELNILKGRRWDAVIDTSGYQPRVVRASAELLRDSAEHYTMISTIAAYPDFSQKGINESMPVRKPADNSTEEVNANTYGALKAACESVVEESFPKRTLIIRGGVLVGPFDYANRFLYWIRRVVSGSRILAPGSPNRQIQMVDARDLADWIIRLADMRQNGIYNATGPDYQLTMGHLLEACIKAAGGDAQLCWVSDRFLLDKRVGVWNELPLWIPEELLSQYRGLMALDCSKAIRAGLTYRPLANTVCDTLIWLRAQSEQLAAPQGSWDMGIGSTLTAERERDLLQAWQALDSASSSAGISISTPKNGG